MPAGTVFAYGQTSSGKTHTMRGTPQEPGITLLAVQDIFNHIATTQDREFLLRVSYMEVWRAHFLHPCSQLVHKIRATKYSLLKCTKPTLPVGRRTLQASGQLAQVRCTSSQPVAVTAISCGEVRSTGTACVALACVTANMRAKLTLANEMRRSGARSCTARR